MTDPQPPGGARKRFRVTVTVVVAADSVDDAASRAAEVVSDPDAWLRIVIETENADGPSQ